MGIDTTSWDQCQKHVDAKKMKIDDASDVMVVGRRGRHYERELITEHVSEKAKSAKN